MKADPGGTTEGRVVALGGDFLLPEAGPDSPYPALALGLLLSVALISLLRWLGGVASLCRWTREGALVRRIGRVRVRVAEGAFSPFSFWLPGYYGVVLPADLVLRPELFAAALRHEIQHHRQGDTRWMHVLSVGKVCFALNPLWWLWCRRLEELHEFACDEALVARRVSAHAYSRCLLWVAELVTRRRLLAGPASLAVGAQSQQLRRRILMILQTQRRAASPWFGKLVFLGALLASVSAAFAAGSLVQDRRVSLSQARKMSRVVSRDFPVVINPAVLRWLNHYVGTPDGRRYIRESLERMEAYEPMIRAKLAQYGAPAELLAVPLLESGYRNLPSSVNPVGAAGLWQFIASTARNYNLRVDDEVDQRLDAERETDAAMRYLMALYYRFEDWGLALMAYNAGENRVQRGIRETGQRDPWKLIEAGFENDQGYLAKIMAGVLIIANPETVQ